MKRSLPIVLLLIVAAFVVWWLARSDDAAPNAGERANARSSARVEDAGPRADAAPQLAGVVEPGESTRDASAIASAPSAAQPTPSTPAKVDKSARDWVQLLIQDRFGAAIANADVKMVGLRTQREPGSHYSWPDEPSVGRSDAQGKVRLWHPVWVNSDDETGSLTFLVTHPEYVAKTVDQFEIGPEPRVVVLDRGAFVIVSGWIDSPSERITAVEPHLTWEVRLAKDAWQPIRDGRLSTANIPPGEHALYLSYSHPERGVCFSAVARFTLADAEQKELHLQLFPPRRLEGRLEDEVPRPVRNGLARLNLQIGAGPSSPVRALRAFDAPIREDGTFTFANLPPGDGQIIALCDGWASERVDAAEHSAAPARAPSEPQPDAHEAWRLRDARFVAQRVDPAEFAEAGRVFVLAMEPTSSLKATLKRADGTPAAGVKLSCWPNVRWSSGFSSVFLDQEWSATSDARGRIEITNLPWGEVWYGVQDAELDLARVDGERSRQVQLEPSQTIEVELELVAKEK